MTVRGERILSLVQAPSLWEGWGGLLVVYRIIYPHTLCRRIAYPPERKGEGAKEYITDVLFEGWGCRVE